MASTRSPHVASAYDLACEACLPMKLVEGAVVIAFATGDPTDPFDPLSVSARFVPHSHLQWEFESCPIGGFPRGRNRLRLPR